MLIKSGRRNTLNNATTGNSANTFVYDADGMMVQRTENGQTTNRLGKLFEHNVTLGSFTKHYQFGGRLAAVRTGLSSSSPVSFLLTDHLGSTTATVFAGTGGLQSLRQYTAWGEEYSSYNVTPTGYRYTSQRWDSGLGLYDYNTRYYDPSLGKLISADSLVPDPVVPQAFNRYAYVNNNSHCWRLVLGNCRSTTIRRRRSLTGSYSFKKLRISHPEQAASLPPPAGFQAESCRQASRAGR